MNTFFTRPSGRSNRHFFVSYTNTNVFYQSRFESRTATRTSLQLHVTTDSNWFGRISSLGFVIRSIVPTPRFKSSGANSMYFSVSSKDPFRLLIELDQG